MSSSLVNVYAIVFANPMYFIGILFALWGAMGFGIFMAGFAEGIPHLFTFGESESHMEHARERAVWGLLLSMSALGGWEVVRFIAGEVPWQYLIVSAILLMPVWIPLLFGKKGGGH